VAKFDKVRGVTVRTLRQDELPEADRIMRLAFGTFIGLPDPMAFMGDADYVRTRWAAEPASALAAELDGRLVGTNFVTRWGSVGFFGPLTVEPSLWDRGVARALLDVTMGLFDDWGVVHRGLFTFPHSPKHLALYESYGFRPRFLTPVLEGPAASHRGAWTTFSELGDREDGLSAAAGLTDSVFPGLDLRREILAAHDQKLGDTVLVHDEDGQLAALAVCHVGAGSEAGSDTCYVKFGAARAGRAAPQHFSRLLDTCESFAALRGASKVVAGVNSSRRGAYRQAVERGYRAGFVGVTLHHPDEGAFHHPDAYVIDDWR
jgi:GNAT superfamily N-acetyltransferase